MRFELDEVAKIKKRAVDRARRLREQACDGGHALL